MLFDCLIALLWKEYLVMYHESNSLDFLEIAGIPFEFDKLYK